MLKHPNNIIGDAWFYAEGDVAHAYYLTCASDIPAHTAWDIGHASSTNLIEWTVHDLALRRGEVGSWDETLATGTTVKTPQGYAMAYTSSGNAETGMAWSSDLFTWTRHVGNPTTFCDGHYYEAMSSGLRQALHWRDPFVFYHGGLWHQIVCASRSNAADGSRGTVGWAVSDDLKTWTVLPPPEIFPFSQEMECPQIYHRGGHFYLVFSAFPQLLLPGARSLIEANGEWADVLSSLPWNLDPAVNHGPSTFVLMSRQLRGPYRPPARPTLFSPADPIQPYACQLLSFKGVDYCLGTVWGEGGKSYISDPIPVAFEENGIRT